MRELNQIELNDTSSNNSINAAVIEKVTNLSITVFKEFKFCRRRVRISPFKKNPLVLVLPVNKNVSIYLRKSCLQVWSEVKS